MKYLNLEPRTILIIILLIILFMMRMCDGINREKSNGDIVKINGDKYEVIKNRTDTLYITKDSVVYREGEKIPVIVEVPRYIPTIVDTQEILRDYFSKKFYIDTLSLNNKSFVIVKDTISENKILSRIYESSITNTIIRDSIFLKELPKRQLYLGTQFGFNKEDILSYGGVGLLYKDKSDNIYGLGGGTYTNGKPIVLGSIYWKIKLKK